MSDDGAHAIVIIALLGNPFSPHYARARAAGGPARALDFCALNVAVYGPRGRAWALTERALPDGARGRDAVAFGASALLRRGDTLEVVIDERQAPLGGGLRGRVILHPEIVTHAGLSLDPRQDHRWWPVAPVARVEVTLDAPALRFSGCGYHDANAGAVPLERTFDRWSWSRARWGPGAFMAYDAVLCGGARLPRAMVVRPDGAIVDVEGASIVGLPRTRWRLDREARADPGTRPRIARELEDTPFYARALLRGVLGGREVTSVHETLSLDRFRKRWVRGLLGFRMRRPRGHGPAAPGAGA